MGVQQSDQQAWFVVGGLRKQPGSIRVDHDAVMMALPASIPARPALDQPEGPRRGRLITRCVQCDEALPEDDPKHAEDTANLTFYFRETG